MFSENFKIIAQIQKDGAKKVPMTCRKGLIEGSNKNQNFHGVKLTESHRVGWMFFKYKLIRTVVWLDGKV